MRQFTRCSRGDAALRHAARRAAAPLLIAAALAGLSAATAMAQGTVAPPAPVESAPLAAPPGAPPPAAPLQAEPAPAPQGAPSLAQPAPAIPPVPTVPPLSPPTPGQPPALAQPPAVSPPQTAQPALPVDRNATLAGRPGDPMGVDAIALEPKPALIVSGQATWDKGLETLSEVFRRLDADAARLGLQVAGRPLTYFVETDGMGFRYDAFLPVDRLPEMGAALGDIRAGATPAGPALRFTHKAPYEDIDGTYEGITAYLDAKGLVVRDQFIEEYVGDPRDGADANFEVNVYVQPR